MPPTAMILHLSDLHLGKDMDDVGGPGKFSGLSGGALKYALWETNGVLPPLQTHNYWVLASLRDTVREAANDLIAPDSAFDGCVVTGDISTDADSSARFSFARRYLTGSAVAFAGEEIDIGLELPENAVLCIPGNHDKMLETHKERYLSAFADLPARPPYKHALMSRGGQQLVFYGIDSNYYDGKTIGFGKVDEENFNWLKAEMSKLPPRRGDGVVRVLLLHHHPVDLKKHRRLVSWGWYAEKVSARFTTLEEGRELLDACRGKIDIVMHGHEHFPVAFLDTESDCYVVSAGTTSEAAGRHSVVNSFNTIALYGERLEVRQYDHVGAGAFDLAKRQTGSLAYPREALRDF